MYQQQLNVLIKPSVYMLGYLFLSHGLAIVAVFLLQISFYLQIVLLLGLLASFFYYNLTRVFYRFSAKKLFRLLPVQPVVSIRFNYCHWLLITSEQDTYVCNLEGDSVVFPAFLALHFRCVKNRQRFFIVLFPDSADRESLRALRVMLKFRPESSEDIK